MAVETTNYGTFVTHTGTCAEVATAIKGISPTQILGVTGIITAMVVFVKT